MARGGVHRGAHGQLRRCRPRLHGGIQDAVTSRARWTWFLLLGLALACGCATRPHGLGRGMAGVALVESNDVVHVLLDGRPFTAYHFRNVSRPFLYPLLNADGHHLTRRWPQEEGPGEEHDHPHHHSFWYSHGDVNGVDLWSEVEKAGRTIHQYFVRKESGPDVGVLATRNEWRAKDGKLLGHDERTYRFHRPKGDVRMIDFEVTIHASAGDLTLGDTKEGTFAIRVAESMRVKQPKNQPGAGHLVNAQGVLDGAVWGKRSEWADYSGPVEGKTAGIAILDAPTNPRHPTWWHARDYGLFAAHPFGIHDFEKKEKGAGDLKVPAGGSVTFKYRVILHPGDARSADIAGRFAEYAREVRATGQAR